MVRAKIAHKTPPENPPQKPHKDSLGEKLLHAAGHVGEHVLETLIPLLIRFTEEKLLKLSPAEIKAVAHDRGYEMPLYGGRRTLAKLFIAQQEKDPRVAGSDAATSEANAV